MYFHEKIIISRTKVFLAPTHYNLDRQGLEVYIIQISQNVLAPKLKFDVLKKWLEPGPDSIFDCCERP